jgi:hypothetical protein
MWEPRRVTTLWAFTASYRIALPLPHEHILLVDVSRQLKVSFIIKAYHLKDSVVLCNKYLKPPDNKLLFSAYQKMGVPGQKWHGMGEQYMPVSCDRQRNGCRWSQQPLRHGLGSVAGEIPYPSSCARVKYATQSCKLFRCITRGITDLIKWRELYRRAPGSVPKSNFGFIDKFVGDLQLPIPDLILKKHSV